MGKITIRRLLFFVVFLMIVTVCSAYMLGSFFRAKKDQELRHISVTPTEGYIAESTASSVGTISEESSTQYATDSEESTSEELTSNESDICSEYSSECAICASDSLSDSRSKDSNLRTFSHERWNIHVDVPDEVKSFFHIDDLRIHTIKNYDYLLSIMPNVTRIGVYIEDMRTGKVFSVNADQDFYAASTRKLAIATVALNLVKEGKISLDDYVPYNPEWDDEPGASVIQVYGKKGDAYRVRTLIEYIGKYSDNIALNMLVRKIFASAGQDYYRKSMEMIFSREFSYENYYTPRQMANSVKYLCRVNEENPNYEVFVSALEECAYNEYATKNMPKGSYFHKNGLYFGEKLNYTNDIGVIYGENPVIYCIMIEWAGSGEDIPYPLLHQFSKYLRYIATTGDFPQMKRNNRENTHGH